MTGLLKKAENEQGFLKVGIQGFGGTGKTFTAALMAIGLAELTPDKRNVAFQDTENGSDHVKPMFDKAGIGLFRSKTRAFADLLEIVPEAQETCSVLIVDSITHIWRELCKSYMKRKKITKLLFQHWAGLKDEWQAWTDLYLNSPLHIIVCGRAGWIYDFEEDTEGHKELIKTGTKMKVETEFGFEPSLLLEMERVPKGDKPGAGWVHRCYVLKDRTDQIDGLCVDDPTLEAFAPVLATLNTDGKQFAIDTSRTSESLFEGEESRSEYGKNKRIALEEIEETMKLLWPGTSGTQKQIKIRVAEVVFGTKSWTAIKQMRLEGLRIGLAVLKGLEEGGGDLDSLDDVLARITATKEEQAKLQVQLEEMMLGDGAEAEEAVMDPVAEPATSAKETAGAAPSELGFERVRAPIDAADPDYRIIGYVHSETTTFRIIQHKGTGDLGCDCPVWDSGVECEHVALARKRLEEK